jgi:flavodoxin
MEKKILIAYYSRSGNTKTVAEFLQEKLSCDLEEIISTKDRSGVVGFFICGKEAIKKELPEIKLTQKNTQDYDLIITGTPVWAWNISSPIRTYLEQNKAKIKNVAAFCTMGGNGDKRSFDEIEKILNKELVATLTLLTKEVNQNNFSQKVEEFIKKI